MFRMVLACSVLLGVHSLASAEAYEEYEKYLTATIKQIEEMTAVLKSVSEAKDKEVKKAAEEAKPKLEKIREELEKLGKQIKPELKPEEQKKLREAYEAKVEKATKDLRDALNKLYGIKDAEPVIQWFQDWRTPAKP